MYLHTYIHTYSLTHSLTVIDKYKLISFYA